MTNHCSFLCILIFLGIILLTPVSVSAQASCTHTVGNGDQYGTIEAALSAIGQNGAGKVVCVKDNKTYGPTTISISGSESSDLIIKGHPNSNGKPKFSTDEDVPVMRITGSYLDIRDLEITSASKNSGFVIVNTHDVKLSDVKATNVKDQAIWIDGSDDVVVDQCELSLSSDSPKGITDDLRIDNHSTRITIRNCLIQQSLGKGGNALVFDHADYVIFQNNELYSNNNPNLLIGNGDHIRIENNLISKACNESNPGGVLAKGSAITRFLGDDTRVTNPKYKSDDVEITNNLIVNPNRGMLFNGCKNKTNYQNESCDFSDTIIKNNTLVGVGMNQSGGFEGEEYAFFADLGENASTDIEFRDNLIHTKNGSAPDYQLGVFAGDLTFSGNLWSDLTNLPTQGNQLVTNWSQVFANNPNLTMCVNNRINPDTYKVTNTYNGKGADISKVGIGRGEGGTPFPTSTAGPTPTTGPTATGGTTPTRGTYTTDFDDDGDVDIRDLLSFIPRFDKTTAKFDVNNSGRADVFDFSLVVKEME